MRAASRQIQPKLLSEQLRHRTFLPQALVCAELCAGIDMSRLDTGYLLMLLLAAGFVACLLLTFRFTRYERALRRGNRHAKPVWKPFWLP